MFDEEVVLLSAPLRAEDLLDLGPAEAALVARAAAKRRVEFASARRLARAALAHFGLGRVEIPSAEDRAPIWPEGFSGSLSHSDTRAFAAVGRRDRVGTIGVDAEDRRELPRELWDRILVPQELDQLSTWPPDEQGRIALVVFSLKEAFYKAQYPRSSTFMDFPDVRVELGTPKGGARAGRLDCVFQRSVGPFRAGTIVPGRFRWATSTLVTTAQIR